jgi:hypothetical protein
MPPDRFLWTDDTHTFKHPARSETLTGRVARASCCRRIWWQEWGFSWIYQRVHVETRGRAIHFEQRRCLTAVAHKDRVLRFRM